MDGWLSKQGKHRQNGGSQSGKQMKGERILMLLFQEPGLGKDTRLPLRFPLE